MQELLLSILSQLHMYTPLYDSHWLSWGSRCLQPCAGHLVLNIICSVCLQFPRAPLYRIALSQENLLALLNEWATLNKKTAESVFCNAKKLYSVENEKGGKHWIRSTSRGPLDTYTAVFVWVNKQVIFPDKIKSICFSKNNNDQILELEI